MYKLYQTLSTFLPSLYKSFSKFNAKAKIGVKGRLDWKENLLHATKNHKQWVWMHCSSLGEFEQGRTVLETIKIQYPNHKIALSFFSPSGYEVRKNYSQADYVFYMPLDSPNNAKALAKIFQPELLILVKYDYWINTLIELSKAGTKIIVISAVFKPNQWYFKNYGKWFLNVLKKSITHFFVQDEQSKTLLNKYSVKQVSVAGDTRFDRVIQIAKSAKELPWLIEFKNKQALIVIGSSWDKDEDLWTKLINEGVLNSIKILIVPHEVHDAHVQSIQQKLNTKAIRYSNIGKEKNSNNRQVMIVDAIGILSQTFQYADLAYVGGGFKKSGIHNTLEPAVQNIPVICGPNIQKFKEAIELQANGILFPIDNYEDFKKTVLKLIRNTELQNEIKKHSQVYFSNKGTATQFIILNIQKNEWLSNSK